MAAMIIDGLTHVTPDGDWFGTGHDASLPALLSAMRRDGVHAAVLAGLPGRNDDDLILAAAREHPGRFIPVAGLDVSCPPESLEARIAEIAARGFAGLKIHPRLSNVPVSDARVGLALRLAGACGLTAMLCTIHRPPLRPLGLPLHQALAGLCMDNPDTRIILVHGGYHDLLATSEMVRPLENVLLDLSLTLPRFGRTSLRLDMEYLLETFDRRICLGSDFPECAWRDVEVVLAGMGLAGEALRMHGASGRNLLRFFPDNGLPLDPVSGSHRDAGLAGGNASNRVEKRP